MVHPIFLGATAASLTSAAPPPVPLTIFGVPETDAQEDEVYETWTVAAVGGTGPYVFSVASGVFPDGIELDPDTGDIAGTPTETGDFEDIVLRVTDAVMATDDLTPFTITVAPPALLISGTPVTSGQQGDAYSGFSVSAIGGVPPYVFTVHSGALPSGMSLNASTGAVSGTPSVYGDFDDIIIRVTDDVATTDDLASFDLAIIPADLGISGTPVTSGTINVAYTGFSVTGTGGVTPYVYSVQSGALPTGVTLNSSTGAISGTPTVGGAFNSIVLRVTDNVGSTADLASFNLTVAVTVALSYVTNVGSTSDASTYTFNSTAVGVAHADRSIILVIASRLTGDPSSVTVNGNAATYCWSANNFGNLSYYSYPLASGTTANIVVNYSGGKTACSVSVYRALYLGAVYDQGPGGSGNPLPSGTTVISTSHEVPAGGISIHSIQGTTAAPNITYSGGMTLGNSTTVESGVLKFGTGYGYFASGISGGASVGNYILSANLGSAGQTSCSWAHA